MSGTWDTPPAVSVLLADRQLLFRRAIHEILLKSGNTVVGEASDGREATELAAKTQPDIAILDAFTPVLNGLDAGREVIRVSPKTKVVLLSSQLTVDQVREALRAGILGLVSKAGPAVNLEQAVRHVAAGSIYLDPIVGCTLENSDARNCQDDGLLLTPRERQVAQLISESRTTKEIANLLGITTKTAESHRQRAMAKLNFNRPAELVRYAIRKSLVEIRKPPQSCLAGEAHAWNENMALAASTS